MSQRRILRPVLFVLFIKWSARCSTGGYWICSSTADCERPQQATTNLRSWSHDNNIRFNASKYKVLSITSTTSRLFFGPWKVTVCTWGEGSGSSYFGQTYLRLTFTPDYNKSKQTSRSAKKVLLFSDCEALPLLQFWSLVSCSEVTKS